MSGSAMPMSEALELPAAVAVAERPAASGTGSHPPETALLPAGRARPSTLRRALTAAWTWFFGGVLCTSALGAVLVVGWALRAARREVFRRWWKQAAGADGGAHAFADFLADDECTREDAAWPRWIVAPAAAPRAGGLRGRLRAGFGSLGANLKLGLQGLFNTWVLTLPGCVLWLFAWYDGWNNSFHKGYEQWSVAVSTGLFGSALFAAAMLYVPMAQIRQAVTGNWRAFYDFGLVWGLVRRSWFSSLALAALYSAAMVPFMVAWILPVFFSAFIPESASWTDAQVLAFLQGYYFWCCLAVFPVYVLLRLAAAKIYARSVLDAVQSGDLSRDRLAASERETLDRLGLVRLRTEAPQHPVVRAAVWTTTRAARMAFATCAVLFWLSFIAQTFVAQFFHYRGAKVWLNQPLVQAPWFSFIPEGLTKK